ncbi:MAG: hypothetical protein K9N51_00365 [Candidatus Pacebacteria bacterium]|nr:hypothetical protein [Candidatus Paceibacterota bacterium]
MPYGSIVTFFALQVTAGLLFKFGALYREHWLACFVAGNVMGITSIYFLIGVYRHLNPNVGEAICRGGYFVLIQIAFVLVYHSRVSTLQWVGIAMIVAGICIVSLCHA